MTDMSNGQTGWDDGVSMKGLWTYRWEDGKRISVRDEALWQRIREARNPLMVAALAWRDAAIADGWTCRPTYDCESVDTAFSLEHPEGWKASGTARPGDARTLNSAEVSVWGPDGLAMPSGRTYDMAALRAGLRACAFCDATDVDTTRIGFAGRCCNVCLPEMAASIERSGWTS